jgi:hypothetical protein
MSRFSTTIAASGAIAAAPAAVGSTTSVAMLPPTDAGGPDPVPDLNPDGGLKPTSSRGGSPWRC